MSNIEKAILHGKALISADHGAEYAWGKTVQAIALSPSDMELLLTALRKVKDIQIAKEPRTFAFHDSKLTSQLQQKRHEAKLRGK